METYLETCATPSRGLDWTQAAALPAGDSTCGAEFTEMLADYRGEFIANRDQIHSRIDDEVGERMPVLISTSIVAGETARSWKQARADYNAAREYTFVVDFADLTFGYWGRAQDLARVEANSRYYDDAKTLKFRNLGQATWRKALSYSPAEPGLARAFELDDELVSFGGWSDLHPTLALKNMGCDKVVYVTRAGEESGFATGVATLLGMNDFEKDELYSLDGDSSYHKSIEESDAVWCTNWNDFGGGEIAEIFADSYNAMMETSDSQFTDGDNAYHNQATDLRVRGCSPGAPAAAAN